VIAATVTDLSGQLAALRHPRARAIDPTEGRGDEARRPVPPALPRAARSVRHPREQAKVLFPSRDFH
jgi:error-prone DNA polymerase